LLTISWSTVTSVLGHFGPDDRTARQKDRSERPHRQTII